MTPCPVFLSGNNWILHWSHYQLLPMLPMKNFFWNICILLKPCDISSKTLIVSQKLMKYKEKTLIWEGPNLSSIPELLVIWRSYVERWRKNRVQTDGRMDRRTDGQTDGRTDGQTDRQGQWIQKYALKKNKNLTLHKKLFECKKKKNRNIWCNFYNIRYL
jgi:hypothetical protein